MPPTAAGRLSPATPHISASLAPAAKPKKPDFFLVGAPKCGTTAMAEYLAAHPQIFMPRKEMHSFGADLKFGPQFYRRNLQEYLTEFEPWNGLGRAGEASVWYLASKSAAEEIKLFCPDAQILIMLREPVEMMYSLYYQFRYDGNEHLDTFEEALAAEEDRRQGDLISRHAYLAQGLDYRAAARYSDQVERYFNTFGRENVRVILYDDFSADPGGVFRESLDFLGFDAENVDCRFKVVNPTKQVKHGMLQAFLNEPLIRSVAVEARRWVPKKVFTALQRTEERLRRCNTTYQKRPPLAPDLRAALKREFASEVERLGDLLRRDLSHWSK